MPTYKNANRKATAIELFKQGKTISQTAATLKIKECTVKNWVKNLPEYELRKGERTYKNAARKAKAIELFSQRKKVLEIAIAIKVKVSTVRNWIKKSPEYQTRKFELTSKDVLEQQRLRCIELYNSGNTNKTDIARQVGANKTNVWRWLKPVFDPKVEIKKAALDMHMSGKYTDVEIGALLRIRARMIGQWIRESGVRDGKSPSRKRYLVQKMHKGEPLTIPEIMAALQCSEMTVRNYISELKE